MFWTQKQNVDTVGCVWNFQIGGGCKLAIFQFSKLKFDMVLYFGLINCTTVAKIFSSKNGLLSLICIKLTRNTALKPILLDLLENSTPLWYINKLNFDCFHRFYNCEILKCIDISFENEIIFSGLKFAKTFEI